MVGKRVGPNVGIAVTVVGSWPLLLSSPPLESLVGKRVGSNVGIAVVGRKDGEADGNLVWVINARSNRSGGTTDDDDDDDDGDGSSSSISISRRVEGESSVLAFTIAPATTTAVRGGGIDE